MILQRGTPGAVLAEASLFANRYHCDALAVTSTVVRSVSKRMIEERFEIDVAFAKAWAGHLSEQVRNGRLRTEILACRTVSERLDLWIGQNHKLPGKGKWSTLASEIGTSPEALYRELAKRSKKLGVRQSRLCDFWI